MIATNLWCWSFSSLQNKAEANKKTEKVFTGAEELRSNFSEGLKGKNYLIHQLMISRSVSRVLHNAPPHPIGPSPLPSFLILFLPPHSDTPCNMRLKILMLFAKELHPQKSQGLKTTFGKCQLTEPEVTSNFCVTHFDMNLTYCVTWFCPHQELHCNQMRGNWRQAGGEEGGGRGGGVLHGSW